MSLEESLAANTQALIALTDAFLAYQDSKVQTFVMDKQDPKPAASPLAVAVELTVIAAAVEASPSSQPVAYKDVADEIMRVFRIDRSKVISVLAKFGATKGPQLKESDYPAVLKELSQ